MWSDVRFALRNLRAAPVYALASIVTLALAVAANTSIFAVVYGVLLKPLPIRDPERIVVVWESDQARAHPVMEITFNQFRRWQSTARSFEQMGAMGSSAWPQVLEGVGDPARLQAMFVSASFFETLQAQPAMGRVFATDDEDDVVVLSHRTWMERFGGSRSILGKPVMLGKRPYTIVGVMPRDFDFPRGCELWMPVVGHLRRSATEWRTDVLANVRALYVIGRLRPGADVKAASDELSDPTLQLQMLGGQSDRAVVTPFLDYTLGALHQGLWWVLGAVGLLLLIACANVSGLTLTRAALRSRDHAVRLALGATRLQIARIWLSETLMLGAAGGVIGLVSAQWLVVGMMALAPRDLPRIDDIAIDAPVGLFTLAVTLVAALLCAAAAIAQSARGRVGEVLNETARATATPASNRVRSTLVVAQIALAVVLLVAAGLVVRSFSALQRLDVGFDPSSVLTLGVQPASAEMPARQWFNDVLARIEALPDVDSAGAVFLRPLAYGAIGTDTSMLYEGQGGSLQKAIAAATRNPVLNFQMATPGYFRAMRIPLLRGRLFDDRDRSESPRVVVLGEEAARRLWPGQDPIGKRLNTPQSARSVISDAWHTVSGSSKTCIIEASTTCVWISTSPRRRAGRVQSSSS